MEANRERKLNAKLHEQNLRVLERSRDKLRIEKDTYQQKIREIDRRLKKYDDLIEGAQKRYQKAMEKEGEVQKLVEGYYDYLNQIPTRKKRKKKSSDEEDNESITENHPAAEEFVQDNTNFQERETMV